MFGMTNGNQWMFFAAGAFGVILWILISHRLRLHEERQNAQLLPQLFRRLPFFYSVHVGKGRHFIGSVSFWADATYSLVVADRGRPIGVVGFEYGSGVLRVYQLQGLKKVNVRGIDLGDLLLSCAERTARVLGCHTIRVQPARMHVYYDLDEEHSLYPQLYAHQKRLRKMYDESSMRRGYDHGRHPYFYWHEKSLRKQLTLVRWVQLLFVLHGRATQRAAAAGMPYETHMEV